MSIEITARHMNAPGAKEYAGEKADRLIEQFPRIEHIHVILDVEKHRYEAEVVVRAKNHIHVEASETHDDMWPAIDVAFERAEKQLRKLRDKVQDHRVRAAETVVEEVE